MEETNIISCQLTYYPLGSDNTKGVSIILELISKAPVFSETNALNTIIIGKPKDIFELLEKIVEVSDKENMKFAMQIGISNKCGCNR